MMCKSLSACVPMIANDGCRVFELLHPEYEQLALPYSLAVAEVEPHASSYRHRLEQAEVYFVLAGRGLMHIDDETRELVAGDAVFIPPGAQQWIDNLEGECLRFIALVSPPWTSAGDHRL